jgi:hypothetical protein
MPRRKHLSQADDERRRRAERACRVGLFPDELIQEVIDPRLAAREHGRMVRELAEATHLDPFGQRVRVSPQTIDRWIRAWRARERHLTIRVCAVTHRARGGPGGGSVVRAGQRRLAQPGDNGLGTGPSPGSLPSVR